MPFFNFFEIPLKIPKFAFLGGKFTKFEALDKQFSLARRGEISPYGNCEDNCL
jgi:hypothetical protein